MASNFQEPDTLIDRNDTKWFFSHMGSQASQNEINNLVDCPFLGFAETLTAEMNR